MQNKVEGIDVIRERLLNRKDTSAVFRELEIASFLSMHGCRVRFVKETNVRGRDFDLDVEAKGQRISVEVTEILDRTLSFKTALNKFKKKRSQVPSHRPAVLYIHVPFEWMQTGQMMFLHIDPAIKRFFVLSRRYNMIVFVSEHFISTGNRLVFRGDGQPVYSHVARHKISDTSVFIAQRDRWNDSSLSKSFLTWLRTERAKQE